MKEGNRAEKQLGCILKMTLKPGIRDEWITREGLALYLFKNKSRTRNLSPVEEFSRSLRESIIDVKARSSNQTDFLRKLIAHDNVRPTRGGGIHQKGGPVLQDLRGAWNILHSTSSIDAADGSSFKPNKRKVMLWMLDRARNHPFGYYKCLLR